MGFIGWFYTEITSAKHIRTEVMMKTVCHKKYTCRMAVDGSLHAYCDGKWHKGAWCSREKKKPGMGDVRVIDGVLCACIYKDLTLDYRLKVMFWNRKEWDAVWAPVKLDLQPDWKAIAQSVVAKQKGRTEQPQAPK